MVTYIMQKPLENMSKTRRTPQWLKLLTIIFFTGTFALFLAAAIYAQMYPWPQSATPPRLYIRLVTSALICLGITLEIAFVYTAYHGHYYSGIARRQVRRAQDPYHFWPPLIILSLLVLSLLGYSVWKFLTA